MTAAIPQVPVPTAITVEKPLRRAKITGPLEKWRADGASTREIKLGERLAELLSIKKEVGNEEGT